MRRRFEFFFSNEKKTTKRKMVGGFFGPPAVPVMAGPEAAGGRGVVPMRPTKEKTARNGLERPGTAWNGARRQLRLPFFVVVVVVVVVSRRVVAHRPRYSQPKAPPLQKKKRQNTNRSRWLHSGQPRAKGKNKGKNRLPTGHFWVHKVFFFESEGCRND